MDNRINWQDFGPFLRSLRRGRGISQDRLAGQLGCGRTYIWRLEHGTRRPSTFMLRLLMHCVPLSASEHERLHAFEQLRRTDRVRELIEQEREDMSQKVSEGTPTGAGSVSYRSGE